MRNLNFAFLISRSILCHPVGTLELQTNLLPKFACRKNCPQPPAPPGLTPGPENPFEFLSAILRACEQNLDGKAIFPNCPFHQIISMGGAGKKNKAGKRNAGRC